MSVIYFSGIDEMPMQNWIDVKGSEKKAGDLRFVRKTGHEAKENENDLEAWLDIEQEYIDHFGHADKYAQILRIKHKIAKLQADFIIHGKGFNRNLIKVEEKRLEAIENSMRGGMTISQSKVYIEKFMGFKIDFKNISVLDWHETLVAYGNSGNK